MRVAGDAGVGYADMEIRNAINKGLSVGQHIYGDDSSEALINFYFFRRNKHKKGPVIDAAMAVVSGPPVFPVKNMPDDDDKNEFDFLPAQRDVYVVCIIVLATVATALVPAGGRNVNGLFTQTETIAVIE